MAYVSKCSSFLLIDYVIMQFFQVYEFVGLTELYYAGSHGMDIMGPVHPISKDQTNCIRSYDKRVNDFFKNLLRV